MGKLDDITLTAKEIQDNLDRQLALGNTQRLSRDVSVLSGLMIPDTPPNEG